MDKHGHASVNKDPGQISPAKLFSNVMEIWIKPEIQKRQEEGTLESSVHLRKAQIIFKLDGSHPVVRINEQVRGLAEFKLKAPLETPTRIGDPCYEHQISGLESFRLDDDEGDSGHITILSSESSWLIAFDFRYNKKRSAEHIEAAKEFLASARQALKSDLLRPFVENLASAAELGAKAYLLSRPDRSIMTAKTHKLIHRKINAERRLGNVAGAHIDSFNALHQLRYPARYLHGTFAVGAEEKRKLLQSIEAFICQVDAQQQKTL